MPAPRPVVLVVDDDADHLLMLQLSLESAGFDARTADSCASARAALAARDVDALVVDLSLGDGSGVDLVRELGEGRPRVCVLLSGFDATDLPPETVKGFDASFVKPASVASLSAAISSGLARRRSGTIARVDAPLARTTGPAARRRGAA